MKPYARYLAILLALAATQASCDKKGDAEYPPCSYCKNTNQMDRMTGPELLHGFMDCADDTDYIPKYTRRMESLKEDGIPLFLQAMTEGIKEPASIIHMNWVGYSADSLHRLAEKGIYSDTEVPVLILVIKNQMLMEATFVPADTLRIITGVDPGYTREYVRTWNGDFHARNDWAAKIAKWEAWWEKRKARDAPVARREAGP